MSEYDIDIGGQTYTVQAESEKDLPEIAETIANREKISSREPIQQKASDLLTTVGLVGGGAVMGGELIRSAATGLTDWYMRPRKEYADIESRLTGMKQELGISDRPISDIPSILKGRETEVKSVGQQQLDEIARQQELQKISLRSALESQKSAIDNIELQQKIKTQAYQDAIGAVKQSKYNLQNQIEQFDRNIIGKTVEDVAKAIKTQYPDFFRSASQQFQAGRQSIENHFLAAGGTIDSGEFSTMLEDSMNRLSKSGVDEDQIARLQTLHDYLNPLEADGTTYKPPRPMSVTEASGHISSLTGDSPFDAVSGDVRGRWLSFLENKSSGDLKNEVASLNSWYRRFKQSQEQLLSAGGKGGEFNTGKLQRWMLNYYKNRSNDGIIDLMKYVSEGADGIRPMERVGEGFQKFLDAIKKSDVIKQNIKQSEKAGMDISGEITKTSIESLKAKEPILGNINKLSRDLAELATEGIKNKTVIESEITKRLDKIKSNMKEYESLAGRLSYAGEKIPLRGVNIFKVLRTISKIGGGKLLSVTPSLIGMVGLGVIDPVNIAIKSQERASELYEKIQSGLELSKKELNDAMNLGLIT